MGVHWLDTLRFWFGEAESVYARLHRMSPAIAGKDMAVIMRRMDSVTALLDLFIRLVRPNW